MKNTNSLDLDLGHDNAVMSTAIALRKQREIARKIISISYQIYRN